MSDVEDFVEDVGESIEGTFVEDVLNVATQAGTSGLIGFEDGDFGEGIVGERVTALLDRITGRDLAVAQLEAQREAVANAERRAREERDEQRELNRRRDVQASRAAASRRDRSRARGRDAQFNGSRLGDGEDLLGL